MKRIVQPELLDTLPAGDPRAVRSRLDLRRLNGWMRQPAIMAGALQTALDGHPPEHITDLGAGDGTFLLRVAQIIAPRWPDVKVVLPDRHPQPGLAQLPRLVDEARESSGAAYRLIISGSPVTVDPGVGLAAFRIVQEALTNAMRHAPGAAVDVEVHYGDGDLRLRIRDNGPGPEPAAPDGGHGLLGMRERAAAMGGELRAGPATVGGFLVEASLPGAVGP